ncbi:MAG: hypothetical protein GY865_11485 [candidate division Zixibacteria bacterium]|nr:hypothetical protein [candidate division Zixibacteria bacterium]
MKYYLPLLLFLLLLVSCSTSTSIVRVKDESIGNPHYKNILISAPYDDLEIKSDVENVFADEVKNPSVKTYRAIDILPPLREYSMDEIRQRLNEKDIDLILVIAVTDFWETHSKLPDQSVTKTKSGSTVNAYGSYLSIDTKGTSTTTHYPGLKLSQSNVKLDTRLFEIGPKDSLYMIWRANSTTSGNYFTPKSKVMRDAATKIGVSLTADGILEFDPNLKKRKRIFNIPQDVFILGGVNNDILLGYLSYKDSDPESVFNKKGIYYFSPENDLWNILDIHASNSSNCSVCNIDATNPPKITNMAGVELGRITLNPQYKINNRKYKWMRSNEYKWQVNKLNDWLKKKICKDKTKK